MVCDIVVADPSARFGTPEASIGLMPGVGVARGLANTNLHWMKYLVFTGNHLDADEARLAGLVNVVAAEGAHLEDGHRPGQADRQEAGGSARGGETSTESGAGESYDYSLEATALLHSTFDQQEGVAAFREGRKPNFEDR